MFEVGKYVVYKNDVCLIKEMKYVSKYDTEYYILMPLYDSSLTISLPKGSGETMLRNVISKEEVLRIIDTIPSVPSLDTTNKLVEHQYRELINSGKHEDLIVIIKTAFLRNKERVDNKKKMTDLDTDFLAKAEKKLYSEFSVVLGMSYDDTKKFVEDKVEELVK